MTFMKKLLTYLGFCPSKESAQRFRARNNTITLKQKEYRNAIIGGICGGLTVIIILYIILGKVTWVYLIVYPIGFAIADLIGVSLHKRREAKKEKEVQRRE